MSLRIQKPADRRFAKSCIFSPPGHGKTHLLGTAQEDERTNPMLLLDFEGGEETLSGLDIDVAPIRGWDDYSEAYELLASDSADNIYRSVGLDSASETHIWALLQIIKRKGWDSKGKALRNEPDLIEQGDYGIAATQMRRLLREFRDLPLHVFVTATSKEVEERGVGKVKVPSMAGQMADDLVALMSIVGYLALDNDPDSEAERLLILQGYKGFRTKVRAPWGVDAPDEIEDPTITGLLDALNFPFVDFEEIKASRPQAPADLPQAKSSDAPSNGADPEQAKEATEAVEGSPEGAEDGEGEGQGRPQKNNVSRARTRTRRTRTTTTKS